MPALSVDRIIVKRDRVVLLVALDAAAPRYTDAVMAARFADAVPTLSRHACVNDAGPFFGDIMCATSLPHVLEHLIIDAQVRADAAAAASGEGAQGEGAVFVGTTEWIDENAATARIEVSYADDLVVLQALDQALRVLNDVVEATAGRVAAPNVDAAGRLAEPRSNGRI